MHAHKMQPPGTAQSQDCSLWMSPQADFPTSCAFGKDFEVAKKPSELGTLIFVSKPAWLLGNFKVFSKSTWLGKSPCGLIPELWSWLWAGRWLSCSAHELRTCMHNGMLHVQSHVSILCMHVDMCVHMSCWHVCHVGMLCLLDDILCMPPKSFYWPFE